MNGRDVSLLGTTYLGNCLPWAFSLSPSHKWQQACTSDPALTVWMRKHPQFGRVTRWKEYGSLGDTGWQSCPTHQVKEKWTCILLKLLYSWSLHYVSLACTLMNTPGLGPLELHSLRLSHLPTHLIVGGGGGEVAQNLPLTFTWRIVLSGFNLYNDLTYVTFTNIFSVIFRNSPLLICIVNLTSIDIDCVEVSCVSVFLIAHAFLIAHVETKQLCEFEGVFFNQRYMQSW